MDQSGNGSAVGKHRRRYFVAVMLLLMVTLGYADQVNMSVAGPPIGEELGLSSGTLGLLFTLRSQLRKREPRVLGPAKLDPDYKED